MVKKQEKETTAVSRTVVETKKYSALRMKVKDLERERINLHNERNTLTQEINDLKDAVHHIDNKCKEHKEDLDAATKRIQDLVQKLYELNEAKRTADSQLLATENALLIQDLMLSRLCKHRFGRWIWNHFCCPDDQYLIALSVKRAEEHIGSMKEIY